MDVLQDPEIQLHIIKEKLIKTDQVLKIAADKNDNLRAVKKKYKKLLTEYAEKNHAIENLKTDYKNALVRLNECIAKHSPLETDLAQLKLHHASLERKHDDYVNNAQNKYQTACREIEDLNKTCETLKKKIEKSEGKQHKSPNNIKKLKHNLSVASEKLNESAIKYEEIISKDNKLIEEFKVKYKALEEQRNNDLKKLAQIQLECDKLKKTLENSKSSNPQSVQSKSPKLDLRKQIERLERELKTAANELEILKLAHENDITELSKRYETEKRLLNEKLTALVLSQKEDKKSDVKKTTEVANVGIQTDMEDFYDVEDIFDEMINLPDLMEPLNSVGVMQCTEEDDLLPNQMNSVAVGSDVLIPVFKDMGTQTSDFEDDKQTAINPQMTEDRVSTELQPDEERTILSPQCTKEKYSGNFIRLKAHSQSGTFEIQNYSDALCEDAVCKKKLKPKFKQKIARKYNKILKEVQKYKLTSARILDKFLYTNSPVIVLSPSSLKSGANHFPSVCSSHSNNASPNTCCCCTAPQCEYANIARHAHTAICYCRLHGDCCNETMLGFNKKNSTGRRTSRKLKDASNSSESSSLNMQRALYDRLRVLQVDKNMRRIKVRNRNRRLRSPAVDSSRCDFLNKSYSTWTEDLELKKEERFTESNVSSEYNYCREERRRKPYARIKRIIYSSDEDETPCNNDDEEKTGNGVGSTSASVSSKSGASVLLNKYLDSISMANTLENGDKRAKCTKGFSDTDSGFDTLSVKNAKSPLSAHEQDAASLNQEEHVKTDEQRVSMKKRRSKSLEDSGINVSSFITNENSKSATPKRTRKGKTTFVRDTAENEESDAKSNANDKKRKRNVSESYSDYKRQKLEMFGSETDSDSEPLINLLSPGKLITYKQTKSKNNNDTSNKSEAICTNVERIVTDVAADITTGNNEPEVVSFPKKRIAHCRKIESNEELLAKSAAPSIADVNNALEMLANKTLPKKRVAHKRASALKSQEELLAKPAVTANSTDRRMKLIEKLVEKEKIAIDSYQIEADQLTNGAVDKHSTVHRKSEKIKVTCPDKNKVKSACADKSTSSESCPVFKRPEKTKHIPYCPRSPDFMEYVREEPKIIPLEPRKSLDIRTGRKLVSDVAHLDWNEELIATVVNCLSKEKPDYVARLIVNEAAKDFSQEFDKSYTPPAPLMTVTQQKLLVLLNRLQQNNLFGIEASFLQLTEQRLLSEKKVEVVHPLTRMFVAVCKLKYNIERVRMLCCNAAYFMGELFVPLMFIVLTIWGDILPMESASEDIHLAIVLVQVIRMKTCKKVGYNYLNLQSILTSYFGYNRDRGDNDQIMAKLVKAFSETSSRLTYTAILILCKNLPSEWTYTQIKKHLIPLVEQRLPNRSESNLISMTVALITRIVGMFNSKADKSQISEIKAWMHNLLNANNSLSTNVKISSEHC